MPIFYLTLAFILNATANILLKLGAKKGLALHGISLATITDNYLFILGIILFGMNAIFYFLALSTLSLSIAYPIMVGMSLIIINIFAIINLHEQITIPQIFGYVLLIVGTVIIFSFSANK